VDAASSELAHRLCVTCGYWVATVDDQCEACGGDPTVDLYGPMFCEQHPQTIWPHDDCAGPGVWHSNGTLKQYGITPSAEVERLRADNAHLLRLLSHYDGWFGDDCPCDESPCPLTGPWSASSCTTAREDGA